MSVDEVWSATANMTYWYSLGAARQTVHGGSKSWRICPY
jgi:hypothetical protein